MTNEEMSTKITMLEERTKSHMRRIEKLELQTEAIQSIATSVEVMVQEQKHQTETMMELKTDVASLDKKVETLEQKPVAKWENAVRTILNLVIGAVVALILSQIGLS